MKDKEEKLNIEDEDDEDMLKAKLKLLNAARFAEAMEEESGS